MADLVARIQERVSWTSGVDLQILRLRRRTNFEFGVVGSQAFVPRKRHSNNPSRKMCGSAGSRGRERKRDVKNRHAHGRVR